MVVLVRGQRGDSYPHVIALFMNDQVTFISPLMKDQATKNGFGQAILVLAAILIGKDGCGTGKGDQRTCQSLEGQSLDSVR
jgi:hypothetical protein